MGVVWYCIQEIFKVCDLNYLGKGVWIIETFSCRYFL